MVKSIEWETAEYVRKKKSVDWFWAVWIIALSIVITSIVLGNVLFAALVIVGTFALTLYAVKKPKIAKFKISERGISIDTTLYPYSSITSFGIDEEDAEPKLLLKSNRVLMPYLVMPIANVKTDDIREYLLDYIDEEELREPLSQKVMDYLGF